MKTSSMIIRIGAITLIGFGLTVSAISTGVLAAPANETQNPRIENAHAENRALSRSLDAELKSWAQQAVQPQWIGYTVPQVAGSREVCRNSNGSWNDGCGTCRLEGGDHGINMRSDDASVKLEGSHEIAVLFRAENRKIMKIRLVSAECQLDAGGWRSCG